MDEEYVRNWSVWLDLKLLLKTVPAVIMGRGAV
jgi:lipopolysaccharide/colanic/teichoic acid biosynthesis glycosyltransferase